MGNNSSNHSQLIAPPWVAPPEELEPPDDELLDELLDDELLEELEDELDELEDELLDELDDELPLAPPLSTLKSIISLADNARLAMCTSSIIPANNGSAKCWLFPIKLLRGEKSFGFKVTLLFVATTEPSTYSFAVSPPKVIATCVHFLMGRGLVLSTSCFTSRGFNREVHNCLSS